MKYLLYGENLIENDSTLKDFCKSLCNGVPKENINKDNFKEEFLNLVEQIIVDDISRTDIDYEYLMYKYRMELIDLMYELDNRGYNTPLIGFFGQDAKNSFNRMVYDYIQVHFDELV